MDLDKSIMLVSLNTLNRIIGMMLVKSVIVDATFGPTIV